MFGIGEKKKKKKKRVSPSNVFRKSKTKGYKEVHMLYLMEQLQWIRSNTTLSHRSGGSPSVNMLDHLLTWMAMRKKPWYLFTVDESDYKNWVSLREDHWILNDAIRPELIRRKMI